MKARRAKVVPGGLSIVAAFEPFDGRAINRSQQVLQKLQADPALAGVETVLLPVDFLRLPASVSALTARRPRALLLMGEAARDKVCIEQIALNIADSDTADNAGRVLHAERLVPDGVLALHANWDARTLAERLNAAGIPAAASFHAGTYACNASLYLSLHELAGTDTRVGFLHVPIKGLKPAMLVRAAKACLLALQQHSVSPAISSTTR